ncbi:hypothetical protein [Glutamicibacter endophyticus]|uniref:hypothetical protein n=1 Tax=Glutamicibacter endophyticus TaxID=1522174 RepID=UPI003AEFE3F4
MFIRVTERCAPSEVANDPTYRVHLWNADPETGAWNLQTFQIREASDVAEVLQWARLRAAGGEYEVFVVVAEAAGNEAGSTSVSLVRLAGADPTRQDPPDDAGTFCYHGSYEPLGIGSVIARDELESFGCATGEPSVARYEASGGSEAPPSVPAVAYRAPRVSEEHLREAFARVSPGHLQQAGFVALRDALDGRQVLIYREPFGRVVACFLGGLPESRVADEQSLIEELASIVLVELCEPSDYDPMFHSAATAEIEAEFPHALWE